MGFDDPTPAPAPTEPVKIEDAEGAVVTDDSTNIPAVDPQNVSEQPPTETPVVENVTVDTTVPVNSGFVQEVFDEQKELERAGNPATGVEQVKKDFTIVQHLDPARQADPNGVYLDDVQRNQAEVVRARIEGREPDFSNPGTTAGDVVVPTAVAKQFGDGNAHVPVAFSQEVTVGSPAQDDTEDDGE